MPVLINYDITKPIKLYCDIHQPTELVHVMNGGEKKVAYASQILSVAEQNYTHINHEALVITFA